MENTKNTGYDKSILVAKNLFTQWDHSKISLNFPMIKQDGSCYTLRFLGQQFKLSLLDGSLSRIADDGTYRDGSALEYLTIMDMLCSEKPLQLSGSWCQVSHFKPVSLRSDIAERDLFADYSALFSENIAALPEACRKLGGTEYIVNKSADISYKIDLFEFYPIIFQFWDKDDEFPPQIRVLWDVNTMDYLMFETTYYAVTCLFNRIKSQLALA